MARAARQRQRAALQAQAAGPRGAVASRRWGRRRCAPADTGAKIPFDLPIRHFNIQRRLYDYQLALTRTPREFEEAHQRFLVLYNTTAHQGLVKAQFASPIPLHVLGESKGRLIPPQELDQKFAHALFPRITNRYGCVTLHRYHFYVEQGLPQTQVLLWVSGDELRAVFDTIVLAEYHCHYDVRHGKVTDIRDGRFAPTRFASPQGALLPFNPQECCVVYHPPSWSHRPALPCPAQQLWLFARGKTA